MKFKVGDIIKWVHPENDLWNSLGFVGRTGKITFVDKNVSKTIWYKIELDYNGILYWAREESLVIYKPKLKKFLEEYGRGNK